MGIELTFEKLYKADGKWVYTTDNIKASNKPYEDLASRWRALMPPSKWRGICMCE